MLLRVENKIGIAFVQSITSLYDEVVVLRLIITRGIILCSAYHRIVTCKVK